MLDVMIGILKMKFEKIVTDKLRYTAAVQRAADAIERNLHEFFKYKYLVLSEPCDCGDRIMHNNGGNYHDFVEFLVIDGKYFLREGDTCEHTRPGDWEEKTEEEIRHQIKVFSEIYE